MASPTDEQVLANVEAKIGLYPDFPTKGILFRDIMPVLGEPELFRQLIGVACNKVAAYKFEVVLGIESRGFLLGPLIAQRLELPFGPIRKKGKLPGELYSVDYQLEYGSDTLQVQKNSLTPGCRCLIVDDLVATGGSLGAAKRLVELSGSTVTCMMAVIELAALNGRDKLGSTPLISLFTY